MNATPSTVIDGMRELLSAYKFIADNEADLQRQVTEVLRRDPATVISNEVISASGRYDIMVHAYGFAVVLELKVAGSAPSVERQAQRYALTDGVDAVAVVTTSNRLARAVSKSTVDGQTLGRKPFRVILLRAF